MVVVRAFILSTSTFAAQRSHATNCHVTTVSQPRNSACKEAGVDCHRLSPTSRPTATSSTTWPQASALSPINTRKPTPPLQSCAELVLFEQTSGPTILDFSFGPNLKVRHRKCVRCAGTTRSEPPCCFVCKNGPNSCARPTNMLATPRARCTASFVTHRGSA